MSQIDEIFGGAGGFGTTLMRALHSSEMTTGGHADYPRASVQNFALSHTSQSTSVQGPDYFSGLFSTVFNHGDKPTCFPCNQSLSADLLSLGTSLSSVCTSAILCYYPESPSDVCQDVYFPWELPPCKSASSAASSATEFKPVAFC